MTEAVMTEAQQAAEQRSRFEAQRQSEIDRIRFWHGSPPAEYDPWGVEVSYDATGTKHYEAWAIAGCDAYGSTPEQYKRFSQKRIALDEADPPDPNAGTNNAGYFPLTEARRDGIVANITEIRLRMNKKTHASPSMIQEIARGLRNEANALQKQWERERSKWQQEEILNDAARLRVEDRIREYRVMTSEQKKLIRELLVSRDE